jgi:glycosyltransferase involved in cell wall biosynthesis
MKKIAYILTTYPCPSETFAQREITQLKKQGFAISVFAADGNSGHFQSTQDVTVFYRPSLLSFNAAGSIVYICLRHPVGLVKFAILLSRLLFTCPKEMITLFVNFHTICFFAKIAKSRGIEHIHAYFLSWPACIALGISTLTELVFSISAHARDIFVENGAMQLKAKKARFITCCTRQGLDFLKNRISTAYHNKLFLNYHGIELNEHNSVHLLHQKKNLPGFIIAVGRLVEKKGFIHLIEAFNLIVKKRPGLVMVIAGDGPQKPYLKNMIENLAMASHIHMPGWLDNNQVLKLIGHADVLVVPSIVDSNGDRDGIPNVILEAFSVGTPVIASSLPGISEIVVDEHTGILVKPGDEAKLSVAIERLFTDEKLAAFLVGNAKDVVSKQFDIEKNCSRLGELFEEKYAAKIKIAHIVEGFVGGVNTYLCNVLPALVAAGFEVFLICSLGRCNTEAFKKIDDIKRKGVKIYTVPMTRAIHPFVDLYCLFTITRILLKERFDIIHTHCSKAGALGRIAAELAAIEKVFHSSHCFAFLRCGNLITKKFYLFIERIFSRFTTRFIAVSDTDAYSAEKWKVFTEDKCIIVNNGLLLNKDSCHKEKPETISEIKQSFGLPQDSLVVATGCRFVEYKGIFTFLDVAMLSKSNAIFVIAGCGPLKPEIEKYIFAKGLSKKVRLLGHICDMDRLYNICDLVVLCSKLEAQPYLLLEAMRANCAIVASDVPGNRELLSDNRGLLVEREAGKLAKAVDYLLSDRHKASLLAQNAYEYFCKNHRLEDQIQKLISIYLDKLNIKGRNCNIANCYKENLYAEKF